MNSARNLTLSQSLKYQQYTPLSCKDIGVIILEFQGESLVPGKKK